jgi:hypothetical protein
MAIPGTEAFSVVIRTREVSVSFVIGPYFIKASRRCASSLYPHRFEMVDAAHRWVPEEWGKSLDFQAKTSNLIHAGMDAALGPRLKELSDANRTLLFFAVCCVIVSLIFIIAHRLGKDSLLSEVKEDKRMYVAANMVKSTVLALQCSSPSWLVGAWTAHACTLNMFGFNFSCSWDHAAYSKQICALYVATDAVALLLVPKLPKTTAIHHVCAVLILIWFAYTDMANSPIIQKMALYGVWSCLAWPVNLFLALRVVYPKAAWMGTYAHFAFVVYCICCFANWSQHLLWILENGINGVLRWQEILYVSSLSIIVNDDLILLSWLYKFDPAKAAKRS